MMDQNDILALNFIQTIFLNLKQLTQFKWQNSYLVFSNLVQNFYFLQKQNIELLLKLLKIDIISILIKYFMKL